MNENEGTNRSIVIGLIALIAVIVIAVLAYPALTDDDDDAQDIASDVDQAADELESEVDEAAEDTGEAVDDAGEAVEDAAEDTGDALGDVADVQVDELVAATTVGDDNCAEATTDSFGPNEPVYVVASGADIPEGTSLHVRVLQNDQPITETQPISVAQGAQDSCLAFLVTPEGGQPLPAGEYEAQLMVNETEAGSVAFQVQDSTALAQ